MTPEQWKKIDDLLDAALDLPAERHSAFLDEACQGDQELRLELESLLAAHQKAGSFIETTPAKGMASALDFEQIGSSNPGVLVGKQLTHFKLTALIGAGGMGEVYRARDLRLERNVAIKVLPQHLSANRDALSRFEREAKAVAALSHPNILAIHDFGHEGGVAYLVMELLEGESLRQRMTRLPLTWREVVKISSSIAEGLAAAHSRGVIHRDIKPENIFLTTDGLVKILDFGIARIKRSAASNADTWLTEGRNETKPGTLMGTIGYMSPEQVRGETVEAPGDVFSLGCLMTEMLNGERPFSRPTAAETMAAILRDEPPAIQSEQEPPAELERFIHRCLEKNPEDRFQSARDLALDLRSLLTSSSGTYRAVLISQRAVTGEIKAMPTGSLIRRARSIWGAILLSCAVLGLLAIVGWLIFRRPQTSVAVLPFTISNSDQTNNDLLEEIPKAITASLDRAPQLQVQAWSTIRYKTEVQKETNPLKIGKELGVYAIVQGEIRKNENNVVINVEMVKVSNGSRIWGEHYQFKLDDLQRIQNNISIGISGNLLNNPAAERQRQASSDHIADPEAYRLYLQGRSYLRWRANNWNSNLETAITYFDQAVKIDPLLALAHAGLADAHVLLDDDSKQTIEAANEALKLDPTLVEPKAAIAFAQAQYDWKWKDAERGFIEVIRQNPRYATAHHWYAEYLTTQGRFEEAIKEIDTARNIEQFSVPISVDRGIYLFFARHYDDAIKQLNETLRLDPNNTKALSFLSASYEQTQDYSKAVAAYLELLQKQNKAPAEIEAVKTSFDQQGITGYWRKKLETQQAAVRAGNGSALIRAAYLHSSLGEKDKAIELLVAAYKKRFYGLWYLKVDPRYEGLRKDPRFDYLLKQVGFSASQHP